MSGGVVSEKGTKSVLKIFVNIFISFIGAGVLGLPYTFRQSGIAEGILIMVVVSFFATKAMLLVVECKYAVGERMGVSVADGQPLLKGADEDSEDSSYFSSPNHKTQTNNPKIKTPNQEFLESMTYSDVGLYAAGPMGQRLVDLSVVLSQVENLSSYIPWIHRQSWLFGMLPFLFLLTLYRELKRLAFFSLFAQLSNVLAFAVVFWFDMDHIQHLKRIQPREWSLEGLPFFFVVAIYCYEGAGMILALEASVAKSIRHKFKGYFVTTIIFVTTLYIAFGVFGYLSFGNKTNPIITLNLPNSGGFNFAMLVKLCLCFSLFFTYPVMLFPVTELIERTAFKNKVSLLQGNVMRFCLVAVTGVIVNSIPSFANLMALIGATCCTLLAFILPGTFHLLLHRKLTTKQKWLDYMLIFLGIIGAVVGTADTLHRLSSQKDAVAQAVHRGPLLDKTDNSTSAAGIFGVDVKERPEDHFKELSNFTEEVLESMAKGNNGTKKLSLTDVAKAANLDAMKPKPSSTVKPKSPAKPKAKPTIRPPKPENNHPTPAE